MHPSARLRPAGRPAPATSRCGSSRTGPSWATTSCAGGSWPVSSSLPAPAGAQRVDFVSESASTSAVQARTDVVALLDLIAAEGTHTSVTDVTLAHTDVPAPLSPFSYVAPADLVLFLGITVLLLSVGRGGVAPARPDAAARRRTGAPALGGGGADRHEPVRRGGAVRRAARWSAALIFGVHWGDPAGGVPRARHALARLRRRRPRSVSMRSRTEEQAISAGGRARHRVRHAGRLHVPARRGRTGRPGRRATSSRRPGPWTRS